MENYEDRIRSLAEALSRKSMLEVIAILSSMFARSKIHNSQIAVLANVAVRPGCKLGAIVEATRLSEQHVCRILRYLMDTGDVRCVESSQGRKYFLTACAARTLNMIVRKAQGLDYPYGGGV
jgi:DNA-binding MarR family transcriptional regulator